MLVNDAIANIDSAITGNIDQSATLGRGLLSQNIMSQLRNLAERVAVKAWSTDDDLDDSYENIKSGLAFIRSRAELSWLSRFHRLLQASTSHYTLDPESSERLVLRYMDYLLKMREYLSDAHGISVLANLERFPVFQGSDLDEYYALFAPSIDAMHAMGAGVWERDRFYIHKEKPFVVAGKVYYEVSFSSVVNESKKQDRFIAYSSFRIPSEYAVKLSFRSTDVPVNGISMRVDVIVGYNVSIRPCELNNLSKIVGRGGSIRSSHTEYKRLMAALTKLQCNLLDLVELDDSSYRAIRGRILAGDSPRFYSCLDSCRELILSSSPGSNVLRYLLSVMNNKVLRKQYDGPCYRLSGLCLNFGCIPFDEMPFCSSLKGHNPKVSVLFECIESEGRQHELFARHIKNEAEREGNLYVPESELQEYGNIRELAKFHNNGLYYKHAGRSIEFDKRHCFIREYESNVKLVIQKLQAISQSGIRGYSAAATAWMTNNESSVDDPNKGKMLARLFEESCVALVYGPAGTGKTRFTRHMADFLADKRKLFLANTNPAVDNLRRNITAQNCTFSTIASYTADSHAETRYTLLVIDECSTVSNEDMLKVLKKTQCDLLLLTGDIYQIEAISFGNWFGIAKQLVDKKAIFELERPFRTTNAKLLDLWAKVRSESDDVAEQLETNGFSSRLSSASIKRESADEVILCLNYDGLYGINNVNRIIQYSNPAAPVYWGMNTYKADDPILFVESDRFSPVLYNNLKGRIVAINSDGESISFELEVYKALTELDLVHTDIEYVCAKDGHTVIRITIDPTKDGDDDADDVSSRAMVPFQVAYAISVHKAQGLEFDTVKLIITDEVGERVTHNIFYTAITRARSNLKIYWSPETEARVLSSMKRKDDSKSAALLKVRCNL